MHPNVGKKNISSRKIHKKRMRSFWSDKRKMNSYSVDTRSHVKNGTNKSNVADKEVVGSILQFSSVKVPAMKKLLPVEIQ